MVNIFRKILTDEKPGEIKTTETKATHRVRSVQGHVEGVCKISRSESTRRRGHSPGNKRFGGFNVNQPVASEKNGAPLPS